MRVYSSPAVSTLYFLYSDHLGSASLTTDLNGNVVARQLYDAWGNVRYGGNMPTDVGYSGQRMDSTGLTYMHARYYSNVSGRFISADTMVPRASDPQKFNRYTYGANNPIRYTDPTGHYTKDEIMKSLTEQYGADEAARIWKLWLHDSWWMWALYRAQDGSKIWASRTTWMGIFDRYENGKIVIRFMNAGKEDYDTDLYSWQGKGAYLIESAKGEQTELGFSCETRSCFQPVYSYDQSGHIIGDTPQSQSQIIYERTLFGWSMFGLGAKDVTIHGAPWDPSYWGKDVKAATDFASAFAPVEIGVANAVRGLEDSVYDLVVAVIDEPINDQDLYLYSDSAWDHPLMFVLPDEFR